MYIESARLSQKFFSFRPPSPHQYIEGLWGWLRMFSEYVGQKVDEDVVDHRDNKWLWLSCYKAASGCIREENRTVGQSERCISATGWFICRVWTRCLNYFDTRWWLQVASSSCGPYSHNPKPSHPASPFLSPSFKRAALKVIWEEKQFSMHFRNINVRTSHWWANLNRATDVFDMFIYSYWVSSDKINHREYDFSFIFILGKQSILAFHNAAGWTHDADDLGANEILFNKHT